MPELTLKELRAIHNALVWAEHILDVHLSEALNGSANQEKWEAFKKAVATSFKII